MGARRCPSPLFALDALVGPPKRETPPCFLYRARDDDAERRPRARNTRAIDERTMRIARALAFRALSFIA